MEKQPDQPTKAQPRRGTRDRTRMEKRARIREAAREVFRLRGYSGATTREICEKADVSNGTLFRHAADKRELLLLIINDDLDGFHLKIREGLNALPKRSSLVDKVVAFYAPRYRYFSGAPEISRPFVKEAFNFMGINPGDAGPESKHQRNRRAQIVEALSDLLQEEYKSRSCDLNPGLAADLIHSIYLSASREWLESEIINETEGVERLRKLLELAADGFAPPTSRETPGHDQVRLRKASRH